MRFQNFSNFEISNIFNEGFQQLVLPHIQELKDDVEVLKDGVKVLKDDVKDLQLTTGRIERKLNSVVDRQDKQGKEIKTIKTHLSIS